MLVSADGIVLRQRKISGGRRIIHIFTKEYGLISVGTNINEKTKKKSALGVRPFTYARYELYKNKGYYNLNNLEVKKSYYAIGEDVDKYISGSYVLEYLFKVLEEEHVNTNIFNLTLDFFDALADGKSDSHTLPMAFVVKTFAMLGVMPELDACVRCGKVSEDVLFSIKDGGIICSECYKNDVQDTLIFKTNFDIVKLLQYFIKKPMKNFVKIQLKPEVYDELRKIISKYIEYYLDVKGILSDKLIDKDH
ncbi:MAG: DNA repair protein RecO [Peptostreptococcaceae bacterium]|nr:DNA repair protein RecO [Peptostreptococcaceae bacterium]